jgi:hypothetical protein
MQQLAALLSLFFFLSVPPALQGQYWKRVIDTPGTHEWPRGVEATPDGGCIVTGSLENMLTRHWDIFVTRYGEDGTVLWSRIIGGTWTIMAKR